MTSPSHGYRYTLKRHRLPDANNWLTLVTNTGGASVQITAKAGAELANAATSATNGTNGDLNRYMWWRPPKAELARVASCKQFLSQPSNVGCLERKGPTRMRGIVAAMQPIRRDSYRAGYSGRLALCTAQRFRLAGKELSSKYFV